MRVVFMGTPGFAVPTLRQLAASPYEVVGVYTQPDRPAGRGREVRPSPVKVVAESLGLLVFQPARLRNPAAFDQLQRLQPDVIVVASYGQILRREVLDLPPFKCLNIHGSLLPRYRGAAPIPAAILAGEPFTGVTTMLIEETVDAGPILTQAQVPIEPSDTTGTLTAKLAELGANLMLSTLPEWFAGRLMPRAQNEAEATYTQRLTKEEGRIDWHAPAVHIWRQVRAFQPWPGAYTHWRGKMLKLIEVEPSLKELGGQTPGLVAERIAAGPSSGKERLLTVQTGSGVLLVRRLQMEGKRVSTAEEFLAGHHEIIGEILG